MRYFHYQPNNNRNQETDSRGMLDLLKHRYFYRFKDTMQNMIDLYAAYTVRIYTGGGFDDHQ